MGIIRRLAVLAVGNNAIDDGARALAAEYAAMLDQVGLPTRSREVEDEDGMSFIVVDDVYGDTLAAIQGSPGRKGYLVATAPFLSDDVTEYLLARPGEAAFAGRDVLEETLWILGDAGLIGPATD